MKFFKKVAILTDWDINSRGVKVSIGIWLELQKLLLYYFVMMLVNSIIEK